MSLETQDIQKLADLARLEISAAEFPDVAAKVSAIVAFVAQLAATETAGIAPMAHPLDRTQRLREDVVTEADAHVLLQQNAPRVDHGLYVVPKVIE